MRIGNYKFRRLIMSVVCAFICGGEGGRDRLDSVIIVALNIDSSDFLKPKGILQRSIQALQIKSIASIETEFVFYDHLGQLGVYE